MNRVMTNGPKVIVYEPKSRWAACLRRDLDGASEWLIEVRGTSQAWQMASEHRGSLLLIELVIDRLDEQLSLMTRLLQSDPAATVVSLGEPKLAGLAAEAGAVVHMAGLHRAELLADMTRRFLAQRPAAADKPSSENILTDWRQRLPWPIADSHPQDTA